MSDIDKEFIEFEKTNALRKEYHKKYYLKIKNNNVKKPKIEFTIDEFEQLKENNLLNNSKPMKVSSKQDLKDKVLELENIIKELKKKINLNK